MSAVVVGQYQTFAAATDGEALRALADNRPSGSCSDHRSRWTTPAGSHNSDLVVRRLAAVAAAAVAIGVAVTVAMLAAGTHPTGAALHAAGVFGTAMTFAAAAALAAQVLPTRGAATGATADLLGACLLLRMIADSTSHLAWLAWLTPFGLTGRAAPFADNRVSPLLVLAAIAVLLSTAAVIAARHRDVGGALITIPTGRRAHSWAH
jgi:ABC-2 type transport system permease protein